MAIGKEVPQPLRRLRGGVGRGDADDIETFTMGIPKKQLLRILGSGRPRCRTPAPLVGEGFPP